MKTRKKKKSKKNKTLKKGPYSKEDFEGMRKAGSLAAKVLDKLMVLVQPGISTLEINDLFIMGVENPSVI